MKKFVAVLLIAILSLAIFAGCAGPAEQSESPSHSEQPSEPTQPSESPAQLTKIRVGASPTPHAEILGIVKEKLVDEGYDLEIVEFTDYVLPNLSLDSGEIDANYFQHKNYLENFNAERGTKLVSIADVHYEPFGIYAGKTASLEELKDGATVAVPNDATNEARALLLLEAQGLIKLKEGAGVAATKRDIVENPKNLDIKELDAAQIPRSLQDVDIAVINGNYAIQAGLKAGEDAIAVESKESVAGDTYTNVLVVKEGNENDEAIQALIKALLSDEVKQFIEENYDGAVVPVF